MTAFLLSIALLFNLQSSASDSILVKSEIEQVTVFKNQAQVQRKAEVDLKSGTTVIVFTGLSETLVDQSIQLKGSGVFTLLSLTTRIDFTEKTIYRNDIQALRDRKSQLQQKIAETQAELEVIQSEMNMLSSTQEIIKNNKLTPTEINALISLYRTNLSELLNKRISENKTLNELRTELDNVNRQISESVGTERTSFKEVIAEIQLENTQSIEFTLDYQVYSAGWEAAYDVRSSDINSPLTISYKAKIYQNTGIDWKDVKFIINSGDPTSNATKPELSKNYVSYYVKPSTVFNELSSSLQEVVVTGYSERSKVTSVKSEDIQASPTLYKPTIIQNAEVSNQTSFSYEIAIPYSVPSDGKHHTVEIKRESPSTDYKYGTSPKLSKFAYLVGNVPDWSELNLIEGEANIYFDNRFVGTTFLDPVSLDDTLSISLGKDERIIIDRELLKEFSSKNFFRSRTRESNSYEISIRNSKSEPVTVTVEDQIPISTNEEIKISPKELSNGKLDEETGIISWELIVAPGETKRLRFGFEVEYPKGKRIVY
tara:strand:+ start:46247 stop:47869 length:1623 start_codon:yes stop_codon:yes gene_type:complete